MPLDTDPAPIVFGQAYRHAGSGAIVWTEGVADRDGTAVIVARYWATTVRAEFPVAEFQAEWTRDVPF